MIFTDMIIAASENEIININTAQVLRGHHGDIGRVPNGSKTWSWPQTEVARHVGLPSTSLLLLR